MPPIAFASSNKEKFAIAQVVCEQANITVEQIFLDIDEIQGEDPETIVKDKVQRAYEQYGKPVVVSDDSWSVPSLNGFPGAYMKSINYWFGAGDWIHLMDGITDRTIVLQQFLAYTDGRETIIFKNEIPGIILESPKGQSKKSPNMEVIALDGDNGKSIAEVFAKGYEAVVDRYKNRNDVWHALAAWYSEKYRD
jgi:inosine/xanthosine triphosphate pyrophosphatase family protein